MHLGYQHQIANVVQGDNIFLARLQNCEKRLLALSCLSVCPHVTTRLSLNGFSSNLIFEIFCQSIGKIQVSLKSDKNNGYVT